jgi:uncharacterized protein YbbC (DUF1343 family)
MLEAAENYSVGRGTDSPFEQIGADWIDGRQLASVLNAQFIPGVRVYPTEFVPTSSHLAGKKIQGIRFVVTDREQFDSVRLGLEIAVALEKLYPGRIDFERCKWLIGNQTVINEIKAGMDPVRIERQLVQHEAEFANRRKAFLLY